MRALSARSTARQYTKATVVLKVLPFVISLHRFAFLSTLSSLRNNFLRCQSRFALIGSRRWLNGRQPDNGSQPVFLYLSYLSSATGCQRTHGPHLEYGRFYIPLRHVHQRFEHPRVRYDLSTFRYRSHPLSEVLYRGRQYQQYNHKHCPYRYSSICGSNLPFGYLQLSI